MIPLFSSFELLITFSSSFLNQTPDAKHHAAEIFSARGLKKNLDPSRCKLLVFYYTIFFFDPSELESFPHKLPFSMFSPTTLYPLLLSPTFLGENMLNGSFCGKDSHFEGSKKKMA